MAARRASKPTLSTSSFAVLGQVAVTGPLSAYELAQTMRRSVHFFWPRAASHVYAEAKTLEAAGLLARHRTFVGKRPRTEYRVTPKGRKALAAFLATAPTREPTLELEALLRVFLVEGGSPDDLVRALEHAERDAEEQLARLEAAARDYAEGKSPFQAQAHARVLVYEFFVPFAELRLAWARGVRQAVARWEDARLPGKEAEARARFAELAERAGKARAIAAAPRSRTVTRARA